MVHQVHVLHIPTNSMNKSRKIHDVNLLEEVQENPMQTNKNMWKINVDKTGKTDKNNRNVLGDLIEIEDTRHNGIKIVSKHNINSENIYNGISNESICDFGCCFVCNGYNEGMIVITGNSQSILSINCGTNELIICDATCEISPIESQPKILPFDCIDCPSTYTGSTFI